jgi:hypothetical protein
MRHRSVSLVLAAGLALTTAGVADAAYIAPPAGAPDLAAAVLQPTDLVPGAQGELQGYVTPAAGYGLSAQYSTGYASASTGDGVRYSDITTTVAIGPSSAGATSLVQYVRRLVGSRAGHRLVRRSFVKQTPKRDAPKPKDVTFSRVRSAGVGANSAISTVTYDVAGAKVHVVVVAFQEGDTYGGLVLTGVINEKVPQSDGVTLADDVTAHIQAVLAGATGPTGTSGASGTTGLSG